MGLWMNYPRSLPNQCFRCGRGDEKAGPYLEVDSPPAYYDPRTKQPARQYWCKDCLTSDIMGDDSPFAEIIADQVKREVETLEMEIEDLKRKAEPVTAMVDEIRRQIGKDRQERDRQRQRQGSPR